MISAFQVITDMVLDMAILWDTEAIITDIIFTENMDTKDTDMEKKGRIITQIRLHIIN